MPEKRIDPDDGLAYSWDELYTYYKNKYKKKDIEYYWSTLKVKKTSAKDQASVSPVLKKSSNKKSKSTSAKVDFINPVLPGGFPDPSICIVGDDFYLANSSFEYYPGIPIHHSKDLVNWTLIGHAIHRPEQCLPLGLPTVASDGGIQAPSLRFHDGVFYVVVTSVFQPEGAPHGLCFNFVLTATDARGPWSMPHKIEGFPQGMEGQIDPDLIFDDGKCWFLATSIPEKDTKDHEGQGELWIQELDLSTWKLIGERHKLWRGSSRVCLFVEGAHLYKINGRYYLMAAEGGTGRNHAVSIAWAEKITGPYHPNPRNPILTSRHLSINNWVHSTGHADLFQLPDGRWYMICLGIRGDEECPQSGDEPLEMHSNMARETFLLPVTWEAEIEHWSPTGPPGHHLWPVIAPKTGKVERRFPVPFEGSLPNPPFKFHDDFDSEVLGFEWNFRRPPSSSEVYSLTARKGYLRLFAQAQEMEDCKSCSVLGVRQRETNFSYRACMHFSTSKMGIEAGISFFQKDNHYLNFVIVQTPAGYSLRVVQVLPGKKAGFGEAPAAPAKEVVKEEILADYKGEIILEVQSKKHEYFLSYSLKVGSAGVKMVPFCQLPGNVLISRKYTGAYLGLYACSGGQALADDAEYADFDWVRQEAVRRR